MATDPTIIAALQSAVNSDSENLPLSLHLAELLLGDSRADEALVEYSAVLSWQPDHLEALAKASVAARAAGDPIKAHSYQTLHDALPGISQRT